MKVKPNFHPRLFEFNGIASQLEAIIQELKEYQVGVIGFQNPEGQVSFDTLAYTSNEKNWRLAGKTEDFGLYKSFFQDCDVVLVKGKNESEQPLIRFLNDESGDQVFLGHDTQDICAVIRRKITASLEAVPLRALILTGGKSSRMGSDKAFIPYRGKPHARYIWEALEGLKIPTSISCRDEQKHLWTDLPVLADRFVDFGPLGGILSAMASDRKSAWLVIACDLPLVTAHHIADLIKERSPLKQATAYFNEERKQFEPLFAIYEPRIYSRMLHFLGEGVDCPQKVLFNSSIKILPLERQGFLQNINTADERLIVERFLAEESL